MLAEQFLVFSDLDGTLLDHFSYSWQAAEPAIKALKSADVPIILNTSKTLAELALIQQELALDAPFVIENGAAIYLPKSTFTLQPADTKAVDDFWVKEFASPVAHWRAIIEEVGKDYEGLYCGFSSFSVENLSEVTGLSLEKAAQAKQRQYGEPVHWVGSDKQKSAFIEALVDRGASVVQGGRFFHVSGDCDKGQALIWLAEKYREIYSQRNVVTIALGDGENDVPMLDAADIAVQIRSPVHDFPILYRQFRTTKTAGFGPEGWAEAMTDLVLKPLSQSLSSRTQKTSEDTVKSNLVKEVNHG